MKRLFTVFFIVSLFIAGCSYNDSINEPEIVSGQMELLPISESTPSLGKTYYFSKEINGLIGGRIEFTVSYNYKGGDVNVSGYLEIPVGAFQYTTTITLSIDKRKAAIDFSPSPMMFDIPLSLTIMYEGIDLKKLSPDKLNFMFIDEQNNVYESVQYSEKIFDGSNNKLGIVNAILPHFSRYGWVQV